MISSAVVPWVTEQFKVLHKLNVSLPDKKLKKLKLKNKQIKFMVFLFSHITFQYVSVLGEHLDQLSHSSYYISEIILLFFAVL